MSSNKSQREEDVYAAKKETNAKALCATFREFLDEMLQGSSKEGEGGLDLGFVLSDRCNTPQEVGIRKRGSF